MSTSCPHCGAAMDDGSRFCSVCGRPIPAMQDEATVFVLEPGTACLDETDECISPPAASPPALSQREKRIARKLRHMAFEESASVHMMKYVYTVFVCCRGSGPFEKLLI